MPLDKERRIHLLARRELVVNEQNGLDPADRWDVLATTAAPKVDHRRPYLRRPAGREVLASGLTLGYAQGWAEDYVRKHGTPAFSQADALWLTRPASEPAIKYAKQLGEQPRDGATAADVSDLITRALARREIKPTVIKPNRQSRKAGCRSTKKSSERSGSQRRA